MDNEIESLYALLGIKPDEPSAADAVNTLIKTIQLKLKSSIYGGKDGVITLPATLEGKFKNGKEINQDIKDAYAAIYKTAKEMADESVSLTLKDIENFKAQIDKFGKKTAKYKGSDIIANANNNLRQMLSDYQDFVNDLRKQVSVQQKTQIKQTQKAKAQQKAKTKKSYHGITDEEIDDAIAKENARQAKIKAWRDKQAEQLASKLDYRSGGIDPSRTNSYSLNAGEFSEYESQWARELAKAIKETYKTTVDKQWIDKEYKPKIGAKSRATSREEHLNFLSNAAFGDLADLIHKSEQGDEDVTFDKIVEAIGVLRTIMEENGKDMATIAQTVINATQSRYDDNPRRKNGGVNREEGTEKGVGKGHERTQAYQASIQQLLKKMLGEVEDISEQEVSANKVAEEMVKETKKSKTKKTKNSAYERAKTEAKTSGASEDTRRLAEELKKGTNKDDKTEINRLSTNVKNVGANVKEGTKATNTQTTYDKMDNVKKDTDAAKEIKIEQQNADINRDTAGAVKRDESTGFNTNERADELIDATKKEKETKLPDDVVSILQSILSQLMIMTGTTKSKRYRVTKKGDTKSTHTDRSFEINAAYAELEEAFEPIKNALIPLRNSVTASTEIPKALSKPEFDKISRKLAESDKSPRLQKSNIYASPIKETVWDKLEKAINDATGATKEYNKIMNATADEQDKLAAERITTYGMNNGRNPNDTGDIANMRRILQLYRTNKSSIEQNPELKQKIKLTPGREVDTTAITKELNKTLSGKQMRNAQMGGSWQRQILGAFTGFIGMPSLEKSRAQADGLNQILGNVNKALQSVLSSIQMKETELSGLEASRKAKFNEDGSLAEGSSSAAFKTLADLEEYKLVLDSILADMNAVDQVVGRTGGKFSKLVQQLSFTSPVLRDNNSILRNINAGLDKNGTALKFQTRMAEILNYTFQLISRSIGQWFKNIISMLNPLNIIKNTFKTITGWIKSAFQDFGSYDTKWQRTMNVVKINFQRAIKPAMEWIAQKLVNIIGFFNIISMKVQEAFGQVPVDLFDQAGANAEKMRRELEKAANVTAGFDELHDIGSDNSGENDLLGDIYKPQLSDEWKAMAEEIGDLFAGLIKGEKTIGEVLGRIFEMVLELLGKIAKAIWDWFKKTALGKWLIDNWKKILATILAAFLAWKLLKIAGGLLWNALFGNFTGGAIGSIFGKIGGWILKALGATAFGRGIIEGITGIFTGSGGLLTTLKSIFVGHEAITAFGAWGETLGALFAQSLLAVVGVAIAGIAIKKGTDKAKNNTAYNTGLMEYGGNEKDKKSNLGAILGTTAIAAGGGALSGLAIGAGIGAIGGPLGAAIGAAIGGIAGLLTTSLAPAFEQAEIAARNMNNEMQRIEYYEGKVQGAKTAVDDLDEMMSMLNDTLETQTNKVYKVGDELGISKTRMDELIISVKDGTFHTDMLNGSEVQLTDSLTQLSYQVERNKEVSEKLTEAKKKLQKAELDLAIAQDIEAGNFEMAQARIEYALASEIYSGDDATKKMTQILKKANTEQKAELLQDMSPDLKKKWDSYYLTTEGAMNELYKLYDEMSDKDRKAWLQNINGEIANNIQGRMDEIKSRVQNSSWWQQLLDFNKNGKILGISYIGHDVPGYAVGTNYVPNDGLAYLHQGEAVIPKKYNQPYQPQNNSGMESAINNLVQQVAQISNQVNQGIPVKGQFVQRGSDLVATVEKANNRMKNNVLNNRVYAR